MININRIMIRQPVHVNNEQARVNLKKLLSDILKVDLEKIEMMWEDKTETKPFKNGL